MKIDNITIARRLHVILSDIKWFDLKCAVRKRQVYEVIISAFEKMIVFPDEILYLYYDSNDRPIIRKIKDSDIPYIKEFIKEAMKREVGKFNTTHNSSDKRKRRKVRNTTKRDNNKSKHGSES